jgi:hypothetical protein
MAELEFLLRRRSEWVGSEVMVMEGLWNVLWKWLQ